MSTATNDQIVNEYYDGGSPQTIATKYGRHVSTIWKLVKEERERNPSRQRKKISRGPRSISEKDTLSPLHVNVGLMIAKHRAVNDITASDFGSVINSSRIRVRNMEVGAHDFTLSELISLSEVLKVSLPELLRRS